MEEIKISIKNINKKYEDKIIFDNFDIDIYKENINCILGKSGCGKSTFLNIISGILENDGKIQSEIKSLGISYIFQEDRLIEWMTVEENIKLVIKRNFEQKEVEKLCDKYLEIVGIHEYKDYYPQMLSGGLRQRVNIARAFIYPSKVIIMDEPFKSIDIKNKNSIMNNFKEILRKEKRTVIFVTHDIEEALYLGDYIYILGENPTKIKKYFKKNDNLKKENIEIYI
ncbi:MAG: ABC transporter ATP-binding protein [Romboutsia sp.]|uniref:ABC transporter ATP-binding protein n=1 Tax=Romboutsia sp. TaxID=1965302 RepID=UPI003F2D9DDC